MTPAFSGTGKTVGVKSLISHMIHKSDFTITTATMRADFRGAGGVRLFMRTSTANTWEEVQAGKDKTTTTEYTHTFINSGTELYYQILGTTGAVLTRVLIGGYS